ncbi:uncharacterized protein [Drosophila pseudoobscura]|uniref:Uncharacterized protein n=1 Tax=Drosophila pseudoobscura pseudoobscura TaxID=46245 RepID=A0A6I8V3B6_DROPS|nr:uncharacterized protein LOC6897656 [Drosophila pseudoobscura]
MNPACKIDLACRECQDWMTEVCAHCSSLLPDAEESALWDAWWPDEPPSPYKAVVNYMSAFDCHKLRREVGRLVEESLESTSESAPIWAPYRILRYILLATVLCVVLILMMYVVWILVVTFRQTPATPCRQCSQSGTMQCKKSSSEVSILRNPLKRAYPGESASRSPCGLCIAGSCNLSNKDNISRTSYRRQEQRNIRWKADNFCR